jgi:hypothetical protein
MVPAARNRRVVLLGAGGARRKSSGLSPLDAPCHASLRPRCPGGRYAPGRRLSCPATFLAVVARVRSPARPALGHRECAGAEDRGDGAGEEGCGHPGREQPWRDRKAKPRLADCVSKPWECRRVDPPTGAAWAITGRWMRAAGWLGRPACASRWIMAVELPEIVERELARLNAALDGVGPPRTGSTCSSSPGMCAPSGMKPQNRPPARTIRLGGTGMPWPALAL